MIGQHFPAGEFLEEKEKKLCATRFVELVFVSMMCVCVLGIIYQVVFPLQKGEKLSLCTPALALTMAGKVKEFDSNACTCDPYKIPSRCHSLFTREILCRHAVSLPSRGLVDHSA